MYRWFAGTSKNGPAMSVPSLAQDLVGRLQLNKRLLNILFWHRDFKNLPWEFQHYFCCRNYGYYHHGTNSYCQLSYDFYGRSSIPGWHWSSYKNSLPGTRRLLDVAWGTAKLLHLVDDHGKLFVLVGSTRCTERPHHQRGQKQAGLFFVGCRGHCSFHQ